MGLWERLYWPKRQAVGGQFGKPFSTISDPNPISTTFSGSVYEQELIRACIDRFATACSKLDPSYEGSHKNIERIIKTTPNEVMTWPQFLYRCATLTDALNTCAIVPAYARDLQTIAGIYPLLYDYAELVDFYGEP